METLSPSTVTLGLAIIAFIGWLVRLESKATATATKVNDMDTDLYSHINNWEIHHEKEDLNRRFDDLKADLMKIDTSIEKLNDRFDRFLQQK